jgi:hypothetical protein
VQRWGEDRPNARKSIMRHIALGRRIAAMLIIAGLIALSSAAG